MAVRAIMNTEILPGSAGSATESRGRACPDATDERLAAWAASGDLDAFELLVRRYEGPIYRHLRRLARAAEDAEDLTQETFVHAWRAIGSFRPTAGFRPWLYRIATNAALSHLRRRRPEMVTLDESHLQAADPRTAAAAEAVSREEDARAVRAAVGQLPDDARALVSMRYSDGLPLDEIARVLGRKPGAVAVMLHRVRARIQSFLNQHREDES